MSFLTCLVHLSLPFIFFTFSDFPSLGKPDLLSQRVTPIPPHPTGYSKPTGILWRDAFPQKSRASDHLEKLLRIDPVSTPSPVYQEKAPSQSSQFPSGRRVGHLLPENMTTLPTTVAAAALHTVSTSPEPRPLVPTGAPAIPSASPQPQAAATARPAATVTPQPPTVISAILTPAGVTPQAHVTTSAIPTTVFQAPADLKGPPETMPLREISNLTVTAEQVHNPATGLLPNVGSPAANKTAPQEHGKTSVGGSPQHGVPEGEPGLPYEKWLLVGTLLFGVLFLTIGLVLLGRMLLESLHRKRYSRLDYLINGIYVDI